MASSPVSITKRYVVTSGGQVHLRESGVGSSGIPLICLHATAYSSRSFEALMRALGGSRHVLAIDLPGYGESDAPAGPLDIPGYAKVVAQAILAAVGAGPVDLLGYHTGVVVAAEIAISRLIDVAAMTFIGVPYFQVLDFAAWKALLTRPHDLSGGLEQFIERWEYLVANRPEGLSLRRGFENFVDELKAWPNGVRAHEALFAYDLAGRFALIDCPVTVLNPQGHLAEPSRAAADLIAAAELIELSHLSGAVLDTAAAEIAALIPSAAGSSHRQNTAEIPVADRTIRAG